MQPQSEDKQKKQFQEIMKKTDELVEYILSSDDYILYQRELTDLKANEKLYERMNEYRRKSLRLGLLGDSSTYYEKVQELYTEYKDLLNHPQVSRFMITEQSICKTMRTIQDLVFNSIDLDISYMDSDEF